MNLYHYCGLDKGLSILQHQNIRMSDIRKSNDFTELELFFPVLHQSILRKYEAAPFPFKYKQKEDIDAMNELVFESRFFWERKLKHGEFSNFVICFSEEKDCLSQWRGYADDAKGLCIGFSKDILEKYVNSTEGVLSIKKIKYIPRIQVMAIIDSYADDILNELVNLRRFIVDEMTHNENDPHTDGLLGFNFDCYLSSAFTESLEYKLDHFSSEKEWRIFFTNQGYKVPDWIYRSDTEPLMGPALFSETVAFLNNRIDFRWTSDDLIPFCPLHFADFSQCPVQEIWLGPKNRINTVDMKMFVKKCNYIDVPIYRSTITYR